MDAFIREDITDEILIEKYGFVKTPWHDTYNLEYKDEKGLGLSIWWIDRSIQIILDSHSEYWCCPLPEILIKLIQDNILIYKEKEKK